MIKIFCLLKRELKQVFNFSNMILLFCLPALVLFIAIKTVPKDFGVIKSVEPFKIAICDNDKTMISGVARGQIANIKLFKDVEMTDEKNALRLLKNDDIVAYILIPKGLSKEIYKGDIKNYIKVVARNNKPIESALVHTIIKNAAGLMSTSETASKAILEKCLPIYKNYKEFKPEFFGSIKNITKVVFSRGLIVDTDENNINTFLPIKFFAYSILIISIMFLAGLSAANLSLERDNRLWERLLITSGSTMELLTTKILASSIASLGLIFVFIIIKNKFLIFSNSNESILALILVLCFLAIASSSLAIFVATIARNFTIAAFVTSIIILLMAIIGGGIYPNHLLPDNIKLLGQFTLFGITMEGLNHSIIDGMGSKLALCLLKILSWGSIFVVLSRLKLYFDRRGYLRSKLK